jgi:hypothetical protein
VTFAIGVAGSIVRYKKTIAQFGGPLHTRIHAISPVRQFINLGHQPPCKHPVFLGTDPLCRALLIDAQPGSIAALGAKVGFTVMTPGAPAMSPNAVALSIPNTSGLVAKSASLGKTGTFTNKATSAGLPWTTGRVIVSSPEALGYYERFTLTGKDSRMSGIGTISLVSGGLANRTVSGPNGTRAWLRLTVPEPDSAVGSVVALAVLALCHAWARRR